MKKIFPVLCLAFAAAGCSKSSLPKPIVPIIPIITSCKIADDTTTLVGNYSVNKYMLNAQGDPATVERFGAGGTKQFTKQITYLSAGVIKKIVTTSSGGVTELIYNYAAADPLPADASMTFNGSLVWSYLFSYDTKQRLSRVTFVQAPPGLFGWTLDINYNAEDNVTSLEYTTPSNPSPHTTITAANYDNKPNPYASIPFWKFMMNAAWDNYDPEPVLTALSKNNPLGYTFGTYTRTMGFEYNENGFPVVRRNTNKNPNGEYTFTESFGYSCK